MKYAYFAIGPFYKTIALILLITVIDDIMNDKSNICNITCKSQTCKS